MASSSEPLSEELKPLLEAEPLSEELKPLLEDGQKASAVNVNELKASPSEPSDEPFLKKEDELESPLTEPFFEPRSGPEESKPPSPEINEEPEEDQVAINIQSSNGSPQMDAARRGIVYRVLSRFVPRRLRYSAMETPAPLAPRPRPKLTGFLRYEHIKEIKELETKRDELNRIEIELDKRCEEILGQLVSNINLYVGMTSVAFVGGFLIQNRDSLFGLLILMAFTFCVGVGLTFYSCYRSLERLKWKKVKTRSELKKLRDRCLELQIQIDTPYVCPPTREADLSRLSADSRLKRMLDTLPRVEKTKPGEPEQKERFVDEYLGFLCISALTCLFYIIGSVGWAYYMHKGSGEHKLFRIVPGT
ncbi:unnamed protein product [Cuscuta epithymum]|uniref:Transmembrane protein 199 n=1 Tax=Cuscuta epithymum TaxID=186058 RepID=A0AAV0EMN3_9ASTE|nr:unnamed protein product [Cuscuta epithymum]